MPLVDDYKYRELVLGDYEGDYHFFVSTFAEWVANKDLRCALNALVKRLKQRGLSHKDVLATIHYVKLPVDACYGIVNGGPYGVEESEFMGRVLL